MKNENWQKKANQNQNERRKGAPTFSAVRLANDQEKEWLDSIVKKYDGTKKDSLIAAYKLLEKELKK